MLPLLCQAFELWEQALPRTKCSYGCPFTLLKLSENVQVLTFYSPSIGASTCADVKVTFSLLAGFEIVIKALTLKVLLGLGKITFTL